MGLFDAFFKKNRNVQGTGLKTFTESAPVFTSWGGETYEQELTRSAISAFADACSKLKPEYVGGPEPSVERMVASDPNPLMTWPVFLKRVGALYQSQPTMFIVPTFAPDGVTKRGLMPLLPSSAELLDFRGEYWVRFHMQTGDVAALELENVCMLSRFQVRSDVFGEPDCIDSTMSLIHVQNQAQENALKSGGNIRFIGAVEGTMRADDLRKKREAFIEDNFRDNESGLMLYDNTIRDIKQVDHSSYVIPEDEMRRIQENVCTYYHTNMDILQSRYTEDVWGAWYEGSVEPFAVALSEGLSRLLLSPVQRAHGKRVSFSANRLEYASNASKRNMIRDMLDRGVFSINDAREILQLPPVEGGDVRVIRGEYVNAASVSTALPSKERQQGNGRAPRNVDESDSDPGGDDDIYGDSDEYGSKDEEK